MAKDTALKIDLLSLFQIQLVTTDNNNKKNKKRVNLKSFLIFISGSAYSI